MSSGARCLIVCLDTHLLPYIVYLFACLVIFNAFLSADFLIPSECQTDWIQIRLDILLGLICVQTVCKSYQQTAPVGKELIHKQLSSGARCLILCLDTLLLPYFGYSNSMYLLYPATKVWWGIMLYPSVSSVCPSAPFPIDNLSIFSRIFFKFCIHIVIGDEWYGIVNGQNPSIFNRVTALFRIGKMVSGLLFLYCSWYLNETSQICCTSKITYCD